MRRYIIILLCLIGIQVYAADYVPYVVTSTAPAASMQSVNNTSYMSSGSTYSSAVYTVNSESPYAAASGRGVRKAPPGTDDTGHDPSNPQFSPIGDAVIPLLIMALIYMLVAYRRKTKVSDLCS